MSRPLLIVGAGELAEIACEYFTHDSDRTVAGFAVEAAYRKADTWCDRPVVDFETVERHFPPDAYDAFVAVSASQLNRPRRRLFEATRAKGYRLASYVSSRAFVWRTAVLGENVFIFENNVVQHGCRIEDNVVLWSGNHVGHRSVIGAHSFVTSHVVVSGFCTVGQSCFLGVNATLVDEISIGEDGFIAAGAVVTRSTEPGRMYRGNPAEPAKASVYRYFRIPEPESGPGEQAGLVPPPDAR